MHGVTYADVPLIGVAEARPHRLRNSFHRFYPVAPQLSNGRFRKWFSCAASRRYPSITPRNLPNEQPMEERPQKHCEVEHLMGVKPTRYDDWPAAELHDCADGVGEPTKQDQLNRGKTKSAGQHHSAEYPH